MPASKSGGTAAAPARQPITLRALAEHLGLSPATVSLVMNRSPAAKSIPNATQQRILAAARKLDYRPNYMARSLRRQRTFTIGVLVPEVSEGYAAMVMGGIEECLLREGYFYMVVSHRHRDDLIDEYPKLLIERAVEGLIAVDTPYDQDLGIPVVAISGHGDQKGLTRIVLNQRRGAELALEHLHGLGHRRVAFIKGQEFSSDTKERWDAIVRAGAHFEMKISKDLVAQLDGDSPSPEPGYLATQRLLATRAQFTAVFAFNDMAAIGAMRALREAGRRIPQDVSVVGFDDIRSAAYQHPALTTVRQPLRRMGELAADMLLRRIANPHSAGPSRVTVEPELIVRASTSHVFRG